MFDLQRVNDGLTGTIFAGKLHHFSTVHSTQTLALAAAQAEAEAGQVYIADEQTGGRGRGSHTWHSEPDRGLYLTALVRPDLRAEDALKLSLATGLAAQWAIAEICGFHIDLRWPNDLVTAGPRSRKLGGILAETALSTSGELRFAVIGIGLNLNQPEMPAGLQDTATSLLIETGQRTQKEPLAIALLRALHAECDALIAAPEEVPRRFAAGSTWALGKYVRVAEGDGYTGVTAGLTPAGLLRVHCPDGSERVVRHGGVREL